MRVTGLSEFLVYGLIFLAIIGFNVLKQVLAARREQQRRRARIAQQGQTMEPVPQAGRQPVQAPPERIETGWGRPAETEPADTPVVVMAPVEQPLEVVLAREREQRRQERLATARQQAKVPVRSHPVTARRRLLHTRADLRHGIVLMTVLGPCRALQPYDQEHG